MTDKVDKIVKKLLIKHIKEYNSKTYDNLQLEELRNKWEKEILSYGEQVADRYIAIVEKI